MADARNADTLTIRRVALRFEHALRFSLSILRKTESISFGVLH
jgi:hypothetical protein